MDNIISGVYEIRNQINNHIYIGSAVNVRVRWNEHKNELRKNKHHSIYLQRAFNKYGEENFVFTVLEVVNDKKTRIKTEQNFIDALHPEYNVDPHAHSRLGAKASPSTLEKMRLVGSSLSEERREAMRQNMLNVVIPSAKEWHGTQEGITWHKEHYKRWGHTLHSEHDIICDQCGDKFKAEHGKFCSGGCKSKWRRDQGIDDVDKNCIVCGGEFTVNKYAKTETCSKSCASKLLWINHKRRVRGQ